MPGGGVVLASRTLILLISSLLLVMSHSLINAQVSPYFLDALCLNRTSNYKYTAGDKFAGNLNRLLYRKLYIGGGDSISANKTEGEYPDRVYGIFLCRGDVSPKACQNCIDTASDQIVNKCPFYKEAIIWYDQCLIRYTNRDIFPATPERYEVVMWNTQNASDPDRFNDVVRAMFDKLIVQATTNISNRMYARGEANITSLQTLYSMVQCLSDLSPEDCSKCLSFAVSETLNWSAGKQGGRALTPSCIIRYELYPFLGDTRVEAQPPSPDHSTNNGTKSSPPAVLPEPHFSPEGRRSPPGRKRKEPTSIIIGASVSGGFVVALLGCLMYYSYMMRSKRREQGEQEHSQVVQLIHLAGENLSNEYSNEDLIGERGEKSQDFPLIRLDVIKTATQHFSEDNKLGEGGFGPVYKGTLADGKEIAVKRLSRTSGQGLQEFKNEVILIARLQHRNLVRLLGCCLEGNELLLIYEFMPNKSLDVFLFDSTKGVALDWKKRLNIIKGIVRGIMYLHEDSRLRIIHRDLKASNVLLDHEMNPKISDFGMARIFGGNQIEDNTNRVVGTYGYMAPEYAMEGLFSIKSDVFSFGVLMLEIVSGKKNNRFLSQNGQSLITYAWELWSEGQGLELLDPLLAESSVLDEVLKCIHIGLLCVQEDPANRPTMSFVVATLVSDTISLPRPTRPAFSIGRVVLPSAKMPIVDQICSVNEVTHSDLSPR